MATWQVHYEHISRLLGINDGKILTAIQDAVWVSLDATSRADWVDTITNILTCLQKDFGLDKNINYDNIITPNPEHQWYTHLGWDYDYTTSNTAGWSASDLQDQQSRFLRRKKIITDVVGNIFPFYQEHLRNRQSAQKNINSLSALLYYTHIAGDLRFNETETYLPAINMFISELDKHLHVLFGSWADKVITNILSYLNNVTFQNNAEVMDKTLDELFNAVSVFMEANYYIIWIHSKVWPASNVKWSTLPRDDSPWSDICVPVNKFKKSDPADRNPDPL